MLRQIIKEEVQSSLTQGPRGSERPGSFDLNVLKDMSLEDLRTLQTAVFHAINDHLFRAKK
jgi:hypothetical protein